MHQFHLGIHGHLVIYDETSVHLDVIIGHFIGHCEI